MDKSLLGQGIPGPMGRMEHGPASGPHGPANEMDRFRAAVVSLQMTEPQITYRGMHHSPAMDSRIRELAAKLEEFHPGITSCHVVIDEAARHKNKGNLFEVRVDIHVPGHEIVATHQHNEDAYAAITAAFEAVVRQLEEVHRKGGEVKRHREERGDTLP
jgi:ribosomal subunit interface protein